MSGSDKTIAKIVLTGGPCAGKSTALSRIEKEFSKQGWHCMFVPEQATELMSTGIGPGTVSSPYLYQKIQLEGQLFREKLCEVAAKNSLSDKVLIVCDRGALDGKAYMSDKEFRQMASEFGTSEVALRDRYDAVFHLETTAKGALDAYTNANNSVRTETPEQAAALDDKVIAAWTGHPHLRIIQNTESGIDGKMSNLMREIAASLGEPVPNEIERKFLIEKPDVDKLMRDFNCKPVEIRQFYLRAPEGEEHRIRQRGSDGTFVYTETVKSDVPGTNGEVRTEREQRLTEHDFIAKLVDMDPNKQPVQKTRYCLTDNGHYYELDMYPTWKDHAIMEIELSSPDEQFTIPKGINVIREVTNDRQFRNSSLAVNPIPAEVSDEVLGRGNLSKVQRRMPSGFEDYDDTGNDGEDASFGF